MICKRFIVSGRVQGVWYRASTQRISQQLGITGWVRNLDNGDVELLACGETTQLETLETWLWKGPQYANVESVKSFEQNYQHFAQFAVR